MVKQLQLVNQLRPIDVIVVKKKNGLGRILNHYVVYLGNGTFIDNLSEGVKIIPHLELLNLLQNYEPVKIRRFTGNHFDIENAKQRALQKLGSRYSFFGFNCEHFANWVQFGNEKSSQVMYGFLILAGLITLKLVSNGEGKK